jgi:uncharacterized integral membrane protein
VFKFFAWVIGLPVIVAAAFFAVTNQGPVTLDFWPTEYVIEMPLYWAVLGALLAGFIIGVFLTWIGNGSSRAEVRAYRRELNSARRELAEYKSRAQR